MRFAFVVAFSMFAMSCQAETSCEFPEDMCAAQEAFDLADGEMSATLDAIQSKIANNGFDDFMVEPTDINESLGAGQVAWANYRDAHCAAVFRLMSGGTSRQVDELTCLAELTKARNIQLRELYEVEP